MPLVLLTGNPGVGKSTVCTLLRERGQFAVDADWEGYGHWEDRDTGSIVVDPPYPVPAGWLDRFAWKISQEKVEALADAAGLGLVFLCGSAENEGEVRHLFDLVICLIADDTVVEDRLRSRTENAFGAHPEELAAALRWNAGMAATYRNLGAVVIDSNRPPSDVARAVLDAASRARPR